MLKDRLKLHTKWRMGIAGGQRLRWSEFTEEEKANLSEANLSEAYLSRANLSEAYLSRANLSRANLSEAKLTGANLREANLSGANLRGVNLRGVNLSEANLRGVNLKNSTGNGREIKTLIASQYTVTWSGNNLAIGCEQHLIAEWWSFDDATIEKMDDGALDWWRMWKPVLRQLVEVEVV